MQLLNQYYHQKQTQKALEDPSQWGRVLFTPKQIQTAIVRRMGALMVLCLLASGVSVWVTGTISKENVIAKNHAMASVEPPKPVYKKIADNPAITALIAENPQYQIGVTIESIASGQQRSYGVTAPFVAASTSKLVVAAAYYRGVEKGKYSLDTMLENYPASYQIKQMVQQSNNNSWDLLVAEIGRPALQAYANAIGVDYTTGVNTMSTAGMATFLTKLYQGKLLTAAHTKELLSYMQNTNDEQLIPAGLSSSTTVYHKYGLLSGVLHDVAVITQGDESYALVVYTKDTTDASDPQRTILINEIARLVEAQLF